MIDELWIVSVKTRVLDGSPLAMDGSEFMFGECAGYAKSEEDMKSQLMADLDDAKLELVELYEISLANNAAWISNSKYKEDILSLIEEVKITHVFTSGMFRSSEYLGMRE